MRNGTRRPLRPGRIVIATSVAAMLALSLTQCRPVVDNLLGVKFDAEALKGGANQCITSCQKTANDQIRAESTLHVQNVKACGDDDVCLALEEARHEAAVEAIQTARQNCVNNCHHQGGGSGQ